MIQMTKTANPKVHEFLSLLQDPEVYDVFQELVMHVLTDQEGCQLIRRVKNIERHLGADDDWCIWEDTGRDGKEILMPLTETLDLISERIEDSSLPVLKETIYTGNETEIRASFLKNKLPEVAMINGKRFMTSKDVQNFLVCEIPDEHRVNSSRNTARKAAYDVMIKASEMFPKTLRLIKNKKNVNVLEFIGNR